MVVRFDNTQRMLLLLVFLTISTVGCQKLTDSFSQSLKNTPTPAQDQLKLLIKEDGIYRLTLNDLASSGMVIEQINPQNLRLSLHGEAVPAIYGSDSLTFYGRAPESRYYLEQPYLLELGKTGQEMAKLPVQASQTGDKEIIKQILHIEENYEYVSEARSAENNDVWFWQTLRQQETFEIEVEIPQIENAPALIRTNAWGFSFDREVEEDHSFDLYVNDTLIATITWDGQTFHTSEDEIPPGVLQPGSNTITLDNRPEGATFLDIIQVNWLELEIPTSTSANDDRLNFSTPGVSLQLDNFTGQPILLNINQPDNPKILDGWLYEDNRVMILLEEEMIIASAGPDGTLSPKIQPLISSSWKDQSSQVDLIIITTEDLTPALTPLVEHREAQGLSVALLTVKEIYDAFGFGESSPESIRDFVTFAYENWEEPKPKYLFLVGDATTDFHENLGDIPQNTVPSLLVPVQFSGETVSDSRLADVNGDQRPELAVGRWPVSNIADVQSLVQRTLDYEDGIVSESTIFAADGSEKRFSNIAQELSSSSLLEQNEVKILEGSSTEEIIEEWNKGSWLATYIGHGSISRWGKDGMFELETVEGITSQTPPIVLQLTCLTGLFSHPTETSLAEAMLLHPHGPVLTVAATSLTLSNHQEPFALELLQQLQNPNIDRIGDAFQEAKLSLDTTSSNGLREISDTFALFGDPSTQIVRP